MTPTRTESIPAEQAKHSRERISMVGEDVRSYALVSMFVGRVLLAASVGVVALPLYLIGGIIFGVLEGIGWWWAEMKRLWGRGDGSLRLVVTTNEKGLS